MIDRDAAVVHEFNDASNTRKLDALAALMTDDHVFVDAAGGRVEGRAACIDAWRGFFAAYPDYRNLFERTMAGSQAGEVTAHGRSLCSVGALDGPALWSAVVTGDRVAEWRVHEDTAANRATLGCEAGDDETIGG